MLFIGVRVITPTTLRHDFLLFLSQLTVSVSRGLQPPEKIAFSSSDGKICNLLFSSSAYLDSCLLLNLTVLRASSSHRGRRTQFCHAKAGRHTLTHTCTDILFFSCQIIIRIFSLNFHYKTLDRIRLRVRDQHLPHLLLNYKQVEVKYCPFHVLSLARAIHCSISKKLFSNQHHSVLKWMKKWKKQQRGLPPFPSHKWTSFKGPEEVVHLPWSKHALGLFWPFPWRLLKTNCHMTQKKKASAHVINLETGVSSCCEWTVN